MSWHACRMPKSRKKSEIAWHQSRKPLILQHSRAYLLSLRSSSLLPRSLSKMGEDPSHHSPLWAPATWRRKWLITEGLPKSSGQRTRTYSLLDLRPVFSTPSQKCPVKSPKVAQARFKQRLSWSHPFPSKWTNILSKRWTSILDRSMMKKSIKSRTTFRYLKISVSK